MSEVDMAEPLDYQTPPPPPRTSWRREVEVWLIVLGSVALAKGLLLCGIALLNFRGAAADPNWTWGPGNYLFHMMSGFAKLGVVASAVGLALIVTGRHLRRSALKRG